MKRKYIITIISIVLIDGFILFSWLHLFSYLKKQTNFVKEQRKKIAINDKKLENSNTLKNLMDEIVDRKKRIDSSFFTKENIIVFIENLESIAGKSMVEPKISNIKIDSKNKKLSIQVNLTGKFNQLFQYLVFLENLPYLIDIERMNFQKTEKNKWQASFEILADSFMGI